MSVKLVRIVGEPTDILKVWVTSPTQPTERQLRKLFNTCCPITEEGFRWGLPSSYKIGDGEWMASGLKCARRGRDPIGKGRQTPVQFLLPKSVNEQLRKLAEEKCITLSGLCREIIIEQLPKGGE